MENTTYEAKSLREINEILHQAVTSLLMSHPANEGTIDYAEKHLDWITDALTRVEIEYFQTEIIDGTRAEEIHDEWVAGGSIPMTDLEAYTELVTRLNNTNLY